MSRKVTVEIDNQKLFFNLEDESFMMEINRDVYHEGDFLRPSPIKKFKLTGTILSIKTPEEVKQ